MPTLNLQAIENEPAHGDWDINSTMAVIVLGVFGWLVTYGLIVGAQGLWRLASHSLGTG